MTQLSLKTRMAVGVALLFLCFGSVTGFFAFTYFQQKFKEAISTHQEALLSSLSNDLDSKLLFAQKSLQAFAPKLTEDVLRNEEALQEALDIKTTLHLLFDALVIFSPEGKLLIESPRKPEIRGRDYSYRDYFKKTVATGKPQISAPFVSTYAPGHPAVMLTFPLFDAKGRMIAILAGHVDLLGENFLTDLGRLTIGKSGYAVVIDGNRTRLIHPDRSRIMTPVPVGLNPLFDRAMAGFDGSGETVNARGIQVLASYKHLRSVNWILGTVYPLDEAYASLYRARAYFVSAMVLGLVLMLLVSWYAMQRLISPLSRLTGHIKSMTTEPEGEVPVESNDEIGTLATAFNTMMGALREKQESLRAAVTRAEDEREKSDAIIAALGEGISIQDRNFRILYQNEGHRKITGGNHVGKFCYEAYRRNDHVCDDCPVAQCFADGKVHMRENPNTSGGDAEYVAISASPLRDATGEIVAGIELVRDITERKRAEQQIRILNAQLEQRVRERTEELEQSLREMETFCYTVSHDLRTPLRGIHGFSSILQQDYADRLDEEGQECLQRIGGAANRMGELIDDLLELSRVNRDELSRVPVDLTTLAGEIADDLARSHPDRKVEFAIAPGLRATGDPSLLGAALANIIHNAWKFSSRNPAARIEVGSRTDGEEPVFFVRDNGVGFDMQYADKLFLPFHRLHAAEGFEGTGIGLATVQRIIERHGGRVWAESEPGRGATFFFTVHDETSI
ncbi:PAS domain-containing protein [Geobacter hydrogenophilus]|uniref:histidine kinase n=1 Tax=Geobacter hydrogenophilus TaxID=40983 RepID=A0A9W6LCC3_9BACT|nr:ATP-binding protein [Geobacter hydrogenophilus]MBT0895570.1 PAS domain-containing protein [Geobacter hydrogenophilus]GLI37306.1 histidine kinase [Geobacter hydrogenophilus]